MVSNPALESALPTKVNFTQKELEWAAFGIAHLQFDDYMMSKINFVAHYLQPAASKFEQWACKSEASEEYKQVTLRTFQTAPQWLSEGRNWSARNWIEIRNFYQKKLRIGGDQKITKKTTRVGEV